MRKLFWVYTIAAILAFQSGFSYAGEAKNPEALKGVHKLLRQSQVASFEEIADLQTKLNAIRKKFKKEQLDDESSQHIGEIQSRIDGLLSQLAVSMKKKK